MKTYQNTLQLHSVFDNLRRAEHVLIVLQDPRQNYFLGSKSHLYPPGIYRFAGGGVEPGETPELAVRREFEEELGLKPISNKLKSISKIITTGNFKNKVYSNATYLFGYSLDSNEKLRAGDDIDSVKKLSPQALRDLIQKYRQLSIGNWYEKDGQRKHCWYDYGQMYGFIHEVALNETIKP